MSIKGATHIACPREDCESSDGATTYPDGSIFCFVCERRSKPDGTPWKQQRKDPLAQYISCKPSNDVPEMALLPGSPTALKDRCISEKTCAVYEYLMGSSGADNEAHIANYRDEHGVVVAQHVRTHGKQFRWINRQKYKLQLFGQHLGSDGTLILTEGQIDAMSVYQVLQEGNTPGPRYVVASIDSVGQAKKAVQSQLQWVEGFDRVVIFLDQDEHGKPAARQIAQLVGKRAAIVSNFGFKDANEALKEGDKAAILNAITNAKKYRPPSVVKPSDFLQEVYWPDDLPSIEYPWKGWNEWTGGMRPGQLVMVSGGTGIGKSEVTRAIALSLAKKQIPVAYMALEEDCPTTVSRIISQEIGEPFHLESKAARRKRDHLDIQQAIAVYDPYLFLHKGFACDDFEEFVSTVKHYVLSEGCRVVVLDHFSLIADGIALEVDQRRAIDRCIKELKALCVELKFSMVVVCHLSRTGGVPAERGGVPELADLRGSHSLAQIPDLVVMLSRDIDGKTDDEERTTWCWCKKNRHSGRVGLMNQLFYGRDCILMERTPISS